MIFFFFVFFLFFFVLSFPSPCLSASQNLAGTGVSSGLPSTWGAFSALQHLTLSDTQIQCPLTVDHEGEVSGRHGGGRQGQLWPWGAAAQSAAPPPAVDVLPTAVPRRDSGHG